MRFKDKELGIKRRESRGERRAASTGFFVSGLEKVTC